MRKSMQTRPILAMLVLTICTAAEGFDVYAIAFAAPAIAHAWRIDQASLGIIMAMDLVGMGIGAFLLGLVADRLGRRPTIIGCLLVMAAGMGAAGMAPDTAFLATTRLVVGLGIGGLLATSSAMVAELSSDEARSRAVTLLIGGFSLGAIAGGTLNGWLLDESARWQVVFEAGAVATAALVVPVLLFVPESPTFRLRSALPHARPTRDDQLDAGGGYRQSVLTAAFFLYMISLYFLMKWIPKLVSDLGHSASAAGGVLVWAQVGGLAGTLLIGWLATRRDIAGLVASALAGGAVAVAAFGFASSDLDALTVIAATAGFCIIAANSGFYSIIVQSFPARSRAARTGFVIGAGRAGSAAGPIAAGLLLQTGWSLGPVAATMASGSLIAAALISRLKRPAAGA